MIVFVRVSLNVCLSLNCKLNNNQVSVKVSLKEKFSIFNPSPVSPYMLLSKRDAF